MNKREMPWKGEKDPYKIWLSEIILQQTRVEQGLQYYRAFIESFPDVQKLAEAPESKIFKLWEGLGYYSRCRNLIATARIISQEHGGKFPSTYDEILKLKGIGPYTAAAISSFAFNFPYAVIDGNVFRVLARVFGIGIPIDTTEGKKYFNELANHLLNRKNAGAYNQAIMDFGATVCKPLAPLCDTCIFKADCVAFNENKVSQLPVKAKKIQQKTRQFYFFIVEFKNKLAVRERLEKDIWRHLYEFPLIETDHAADVNLVIETALQNEWLENTADVKSISETFTQKLTHQNIRGVFITAAPKKKPGGYNGFEWINIKDLEKPAFPKMIRNYINKNYL